MFGTRGGLTPARDGASDLLLGTKHACSVILKKHLDNGLRAVGLDDAEFADSIQVLGMHLGAQDICACALEDGVPFVIVDAMVS